MRGVALAVVALLVGGVLLWVQTRTRAPSPDAAPARVRGDAAATTSAPGVLAADGSTESGPPVSHRAAEAASEDEVGELAANGAEDVHRCQLHVFTEEEFRSPLGHDFEVTIGRAGKSRVLATGRTGADGRAILDVELRRGEDARTASASVTSPGHLRARFDVEIRSESGKGYVNSRYPHSLHLDLRPVRGANVRVVFASPDGDRLRGRLFRIPTEDAATFDFATARPMRATAQDGLVFYDLAIVDDEDAVYVGRAGASGTGAVTSAILRAHRSDAPFALKIEGRGRIHGEVLNSGGRPLKGLVLELHLLDSPPVDPVTRLAEGAVSARVETGRDGRFVAEGLRHGAFSARPLAGSQPLGTVAATASSRVQTLRWDDGGAQGATALTVKWDRSEWPGIVRTEGAAPQVTVTMLPEVGDEPLPDAPRLPVRARGDRAHAVLDSGARVRVSAKHSTLTFAPLVVTAPAEGGVLEVTLRRSDPPPGGVVVVTLADTMPHVGAFEFKDLNSGKVLERGVVSPSSRTFIQAPGLPRVRQFTLPVGRYELTCEMLLEPPLYEVRRGTPTWTAPVIFEVRSGDSTPVTVYPPPGHRSR